MLVRSSLLVDIPSIGCSSLAEEYPEAWRVDIIGTYVWLWWTWERGGERLQGEF